MAAGIVARAFSVLLGGGSVSQETPWLSLQPDAEATIYLWVPDAPGRLLWRTDDEPGVVAVALPADRPQVPPTQLAVDEPVSIAPTPGLGGGIRELRLTAGSATAPIRFRLTCEGVFPFLIPGPGIVPSHFPTPEPALRLAANPPFALWCDLPAGIPRWTLQAVLPVASLPSLVRPDGEPVPVSWRMPHHRYHVAELATGDQSGWWTLPVDRCRDGDRLTVFEGLPLFLLRPPRRFPYATVDVTVAGPAGPIAARVRAERGGRLVAHRDALPGETSTLFVPPGPLTVTADAGMQFRSRAEALALDPGGRSALDVRLAPGLVPDPGWYCGDHHLHSYFEDGGQSPEAVTRAARANGLDYVFVTDEPEGLIAAGLLDLAEPGRFLALPGQEAMNPEVHCNALNVRQTLPAPAYGDDTPGYPGAAEWLDGVGRQVAGGTPAALMLNHPSIGSADQEARHAYFRAWWVADAHPEIRLVENFDLPSWYDRLNRGRRLTGLWTTDSHDIVFIRPGARRTYAYLDGDLSDGNLSDANVLAALEAGRCFNTREPGALLYLTVNGVGPGETATPASAGGAPGDAPPWQVSLRCSCAIPLRRVDLVCGGTVVRTWRAGGAAELHAEERLPLAGWVLALAYAEDPPPRRRNGHEGNSLDTTDCIAFTNPVWIAHPNGSAP